MTPEPETDAQRPAHPRGVVVLVCARGAPLAELLSRITEPDCFDQVLLRNGNFVTTAGAMPLPERSTSNAVPMAAIAAGT